MADIIPLFRVSCLRHQIVIGETKSQEAAESLKNFHLDEISFVKGKPISNRTLCKVIISEINRGKEGVPPPK